MTSITHKCSIENCDGKYFCKQYCRNHYHAFIEKPVSVEYKTWQKMKTRCYNKNNNGSDNYINRGITVCEEWLHNFKAFHDYIGDKPKPYNKYSLDRIDTHGNYEPGNVRWATWHEQGANRWNNNKDVGVTKCSHRRGWNAYLKMDSKFVFHKYFVDYNEAVKARKQAEEIYLK